MSSLHKLSFFFLLLFASMACYAQQCEHVVKRGEDFESIAKKYSITVDELKEANPESQSCYVGRKLLIPFHGVAVERKPVNVEPLDLQLKSSDKKVLTKTSTSAYQVGQALYYDKKYDSAIEYLKEAMNTAKAKSDEGYWASCLLMADVYYNGNGAEKDLQQARYYFDEYSQYTTLKNSAVISNKTANIIKEQKKLKQQEEKEKREQELAERKQKKEQAIAEKKANQERMAAQKTQADNAAMFQQYFSAYENATSPQEKMNYLQTCLKYCDNNGNRGAVLNNIGALYMNDGQKSTAISYYQEAAKCGNAVAASNLKNIQKEEKRERRLAIFRALAEGLQGIGNTLGQISGNLNNQGGETYDQSNTNYYGTTAEENSGSGSSSHSGKAAAKAKESDWEKQHISNYQRKWNSCINRLSDIKARYLDEVKSRGVDDVYSDVKRLQKQLDDIRQDWKSHTGSYGPFTGCDDLIGWHPRR